ncbi:MAG: hypothetical protein A2016_06645 [Elusimicrobia bacterium GWF2_62_30]|nr:MAG: hypothetical protein A2016_06645 [Elusimicrobia bacterium GWF2_62_30]
MPEKEPCFISRYYRRLRAVASAVFADSPAKMERMDYDTYWRRRGEYFFSTRYAAFAEEIAAGASVLDIGCGEGATLRYLKKERQTAGEGLDISHTGVEMAKASGINARQADVTSRDFSLESSYDHIIISEVLEHIPNPEELLLKVRERFRKSLIISVPNTGHYIHRLRLLFGRFPVQWQLHPGEHLRFWTIKDFKPWIEAQGFTVAEMKVHSGFSGLCRIWPNLFADSSVFIVRRTGRDGA